MVKFSLRPLSPETITDLNAYLVDLINEAGKITAEYKKLQTNMDAIRTLLKLCDPPVDVDKENTTNGNDGPGAPHPPR